MDDENGQLAYTLEIGGIDVKDDAMIGAILTVDADLDATAGGQPR